MSRLSVKLYSDRRERFLHGVSRISERTEVFWNSRWYFPAVLAVSAVFLFLGQPVAGILALLAISTFFLAFCADIFASVLPFFLMFLMAAPLYDTLNVLVPYAFAAIPFLAALVVHLLIWPCPILIGQNGRGLVLISFATLLGGCDVMTMQQASSPLTLYYSLGLGVGMLALYLLFRSRLAEKRSYDLGDRLVSLFYAMGIFAALLVIPPYVQNWQDFTQTLTMPDFPYRNFCTTVLLVTLPATAYFARRHKAHLLTTAAFLLALLFTGSRSALLFGVVMAALCCIYLVRCGVISKKVMLALGGVAVIGFAVIGINGVAQLYLDRMVNGTLISVNEPRWRFFICAARDFMSHPIFGIGLGNDLHAAVFSGVKGSMVFYHNLVAQVVGSMGLLGIIAYTISITDRIQILRRAKTPFSSAMLLSYVGMLLISMTNPGGFCPLPNSGMMVLMISVVEVLSGEPAIELSTVLRRPRRRSAAKRRSTDSLMVRK
jgi:hypothetical protein